MIKYIIYICVFVLTLTSEAYAQHSVGVRGGGSYSSVRFRPREEKEMAGIFPVFGVSYRYHGGDKYLGGIQVDINYVEKGYKNLARVKSDSSYNRSVTAIELPFLWQPHIGLFKNRAMIYLNAGPYISYIMGSSSEKFISKQKGLLWERPYDFDPIKDNVFEYGLLGGLGLAFTIKKRFDVFAEFRYNFGFSDMLKNPNKYPDSQYFESPMDQMSVTFGVYYRFLKNKNK